MSRKEGREEGIKEGIEQEREEIIWNLYKSNLGIEGISKFTKIPKDYINKKVIYYKMMTFLFVYITYLMLIKC